jgi:hypothetical protein
MARATSQVKHRCLRNRRNLMREQFEIVARCMRHAFQISLGRCSELLRYKYVVFHFASRI